MKKEFIVKQGRWSTIQALRLLILTLVMTGLWGCGSSESPFGSKEVVKAKDDIDKSFKVFENSEEQPREEPGNGPGVISGPDLDLDKDKYSLSIHEDALEKEFLLNPLNHFSRGNIKKVTGN